MKPYKMTLALSTFLEEHLAKTNLERNDYYILTLSNESLLRGLKQAVKDAAEKAGIVNYFNNYEGETNLFVAFKNIDKAGVKAAMDKVSIFGKCDNEEIIEFKMKDKTFFIVKIVFEA